MAKIEIDQKDFNDLVVKCNSLEAGLAHFKWALGFCLAVLSIVLTVAFVFLGIKITSIDDVVDKKLEEDISGAVYRLEQSAKTSEKLISDISKIKIDITNTKSQIDTLLDDSRSNNNMLVIDIKSQTDALLNDIRSKSIPISELSQLVTKVKSMPKITILESRADGDGKASFQAAKPFNKYRSFQLYYSHLGDHPKINKQVPWLPLSKTDFISMPYIGRETLKIHLKHDLKFKYLVAILYE